MIKTFGNDGSIQIGRSFNLDPMGSLLEGGLVSLHSCLKASCFVVMLDQQKLQKTGLSGASFQVEYAINFKKKL
ncbi:hypothetical protein HNQ69_000360 [Bartonella callosciuri]|uniref:Uncharacterized protein n=1 Tax=Bartonella callosciuri TaxID=686223 RepID=A0A840NKV7_9HYPH|nr:hypothetical protein [Bartonella callosciuri]